MSSTWPWLPLPFPFSLGLGRDSFRLSFFGFPVGLDYLHPHGLAFFVSFRRRACSARDKVIPASFSPSSSSSCFHSRQTLRCQWASTQPFFFICCLFITAAPSHPKPSTPSASHVSVAASFVGESSLQRLDLCTLFSSSSSFSSSLKLRTACPAAPNRYCWCN